jgi:hypothetical protein
MATKKNSVVIFTFCIGARKFEFAYTTARDAFSARLSIRCLNTDDRSGELESELLLPDRRKASSLARGGLRYIA